ncbi:MAG: CDP-diacylglycerol--glycerol-3-phosphate 3-phosphatidyltransferase [Lachnospiraceae bacterium]|nr:CDP-diacylglycerol--glycerol-3-phosphate 3-phosphatidyltransferase [Lachnospiraceae bacterium]
MDKNLPNKLTMSRVIAIPIFIAFFMMSFLHIGTIKIGTSYEIDIFRFVAAIIFVIASITDYFDGKIARKYNLVTNFGKLMDPLADKMLVVSALLLLTESREINFLCTLLVVLRELTISSIRLIALEKNVVIAAAFWGKLKTASQMVALVLILFNIYSINKTLYYIVYILFYLSTAFVVISLVDYIIKSKSVFVEN